MKQSDIRNPQVVVITKGHGAFKQDANSVNERYNASHPGAADMLAKATAKLNRDKSKAAGYQAARRQRSGYDPAAKAASAASSSATTHAGHKEAGEKHLAAKEEADKLYNRGGSETVHRVTTTEHLARAEEHAKAAGDSWDEGKHPRDENGKFT